TERSDQTRRRRNRDAANEFIDEMFARRSRYLVLFLTLSYRKEHRQDVHLPTIQRHRDTFFRQIDNARSSVLSGIEGCLWRLEEGDTAGLHLHLLILYSGRHRGDVQIAWQIGDHWVQRTTRGWGDYYNSNANRGHYQDRWGDGLGQVDSSNAQKRESLALFAGEYMSKTTQVPFMRANPHERLFGVRRFF
uniref:hypothetical protein n=1 Tax=Castellaniella defragrans TaxID=75697 RepID=UPI00333E794C